MERVAEGARQEKDEGEKKSKRADGKRIGDNEGKGKGRRDNEKGTGRRKTTIDNTCTDRLVLRSTTALDDDKLFRFFVSLLTSPLQCQESKVDTARSLTKS